MPGDFPFPQARAALSYEGIGKRLVTAYKDAGEQRLAETLASLVLHAIDGSVRAEDGGLPAGAGQTEPADWRAWADAIVVVPATREAVRRRGFDHMGLVAREIDAQSHVPVLQALRNERRVDQRALSREQRASNLSHAFAVEPGAARLVAGQRIVLVDDVLTTGATTSAAADALLGAGAAEIRVAVACRVW